MLENRTGYDTGDLVRLVEQALEATGAEAGNGTLHVVFVTSPIRSRGCAEIGRRVCSGDRCVCHGGNRMVIAIAAPGRYSLRRLSRLLLHETAHLRCHEHQDMNKELLYSLGPVPEWAEGTVIRYRGRAPAQLPFLRRGPHHPDKRIAA